MAQIKLKSEVTGSVWKLLKKPGEQVEAGEEIMLIESMKMEIPVESPAEGRVAVYFVAAGDRVEEGQALFRLEA